MTITLGAQPAQAATSGATSPAPKTAAAVTQRADFNGDGVADLAVYRPSTGYWLIQDTTTGIQDEEYWGATGDVPVVADFNGDHVFDLTVFRPSNGTWYTRTDNAQGVSTYSATQFGMRGDIPVAVDFNTDGKDDIAVFRPSNSTWYIKTGSGYRTQQWGAQGDIPVAGDYTGDGRAEIAVWRPSNGYWYVLGMPATQWGTRGDYPVVADFTGDGKIDITVFRKYNTQWSAYLHRGGDNNEIWEGNVVPVPSNWSVGYPNRSTEGMWSPSDGQWTIEGPGFRTFGYPGDLPLVRGF